MQSEQINELSAALAKAQGAMHAATKNSVNPHFKNRYADLAAVIDATREALSANGLAITQATEIRENGFVLCTTLLHSSGQWMASEWPLPMAGRPQEQGSALTYARRYCWQSIAGIAAEDDDDAEGARTKGQAASTPTPRQNPHVTRVEDVTDARPRFDENGKRIDWIDTSDHRVPKLSGERAKAAYTMLKDSMFMCQSTVELIEWAEEHAEQVATLGKSEEFFQLVEFQPFLDELRKVEANGQSNGRHS